MPFFSQLLSSLQNKPTTNPNSPGGLIEKTINKAPANQSPGMVSKLPLNNPAPKPVMTTMPVVPKPVQAPITTLPVQQPKPVITTMPIQQQQPVLPAPTLHGLPINHSPSNNLGDLIARLKLHPVELAAPDANTLSRMNILNRLTGRRF